MSRQAKVEDELWAGAKVPDDERHQWRQIMSYGGQGPHVIDAVERLARQGWSPEKVVAARTDPGVYAPHFGTSSGYEKLDAPTTVALAVLALETARYHKHLARVASGECGEFALRLRSEEPLGFGWSLQRIGRALGLAAGAVKIMVYER